MRLPKISEYKLEKMLKKLSRMFNTPDNRINFFASDYQNEFGEHQTQVDPRSIKYDNPNRLDKK